MPINILIDHSESDGSEASARSPASGYYGGIPGYMPQGFHPSEYADSYNDYISSGEDEWGDYIHRSSGNYENDPSDYPTQDEGNRRRTTDNPHTFFHDPDREYTSIPDAIEEYSDGHDDSQRPLQFGVASGNLLEEARPVERGSAYPIDESPRGSGSGGKAHDHTIPDETRDTKPDEIPSTASPIGPSTVPHEESDPPPRARRTVTMQDVGSDFDSDAEVVQSTSPEFKDKRRGPADDKLKDTSKEDCESQPQGKEDGRSKSPQQEKNGNEPLQHHSHLLKDEFPFVRAPSPPTRSDMDRPPTNDVGVPGEERFAGFTYPRPPKKRERTKIADPEGSRTSNPSQGKRGKGENSKETGPDEETLRPDAELQLPVGGDVHSDGANTEKDPPQGNRRSGFHPKTSVPGAPARARRPPETKKNKNDSSPQDLDENIASTKLQPENGKLVPRSYTYAPRKKIDRRHSRTTDVKPSVRFGPTAEVGSSRRKQAIRPPGVQVSTNEYPGRRVAHTPGRNPSTTAQWDIDEEINQLHKYVQDISRSKSDHERAIKTKALSAKAQEVVASLSEKQDIKRRQDQGRKGTGVEYSTLTETSADEDSDHPRAFRRPQEPLRPAYPGPNAVPHHHTGTYGGHQTPIHHHPYRHHGAEPAKGYYPGVLPPFPIPAQGPPYLVPYPGHYPNQMSYPPSQPIHPPGTGYPAPAPANYTAGIPHSTPFPYRRPAADDGRRLGAGTMQQPNMAVRAATYSERRDEQNSYDHRPYNWEEGAAEEAAKTGTKDQRQSPGPIPIPGRPDRLTLEMNYENGERKDGTAREDGFADDYRDVDSADEYANLIGNAGSSNKRKSNQDYSRSFYVVAKSPVSRDTIAHNLGAAAVADSASHTNGEKGPAAKAPTSGEGTAAVRFKNPQSELMGPDLVTEQSASAVPVPTPQTAAQPEVVTQLVVGEDTVELTDEKRPRLKVNTGIDTVICDSTQDPEVSGFKKPAKRPTWGIASALVKTKAQTGKASEDQSAISKLMKRRPDWNWKISEPMRRKLAKLIWQNIPGGENHPLDGYCRYIQDELDGLGIKSPGIHHHPRNDIFSLDELANIFYRHTKSVVKFWSAGRAIDLGELPSMCSDSLDQTLKHLGHVNPGLCLTSLQQRFITIAFGWQKLQGYHEPILPLFIQDSETRDTPLSAKQRFPHGYLFRSTLLPARTDFFNPDCDVPKGSAFRPKTYNLASIANLSGLKVRWSDRIEEHLQLDDMTGTLYLFRFASLCAANKHITGAQEESVSIYLTNRYPCNFAIPYEYTYEILQTYKLLFSTAASQKLFKEEYKDNYLDDEYLYKACTPELTKENRQAVYPITNFPFFAARLHILENYFKKAKPSNLHQLFWDSRDTLQWYTFVIGMAIFTLTIIGLILGVLQTVASWLALKHN